VGDNNRVTTVHIAPNIASAASIRAALDAADDGAAEVVTFRDDLSCGPIDDVSVRQEWWETTFTGDMGRSQLNVWDSAGGDLHRLAAVDQAATLVIWFGSAAAQEHACCLFLADCTTGRRPLHVIDVASPGPAIGESGIGKAAALPPAALGRYLESERALADAEQAKLASRWSALRTENAPFRVVSGAELVSVPLDYFDGALLAHLSSEQRPMTAVIADAMADHVGQVGDWVLQQRLILLIAAGVVIAVGDQTTARLCQIRRGRNE
jgi:hypothetical protein